MSGAKYFSKIDLRSAYTQVELTEQARNFTTFITEKGVKTLYALTIWSFTSYCNVSTLLRTNVR